MIFSGFHMKKKDNQRGIILLSISWIVLILSLLLLSHLRSTELGFHNQRIEESNLHLRIAAKSALNIILEEMANEVIEGATDYDALSDSWSWRLLEEKYQEDFKEVFSGIKINVLVEDEDGKINPANDNNERLELLFESLGMPELEAKELAFSIKDLSAKLKENLAEGSSGDDSASLESLDMRYLMKLRAITPLLYYGNDSNFNNILDSEESTDKRFIIKRITSFLTLRGDGKINPNFAPYEILLTIPGVSEKIADEIVRKREGFDQILGTEDDFVFKEPEDLQDLSSISRFREFEYNKIVPFTRVTSNIFTIRICCICEKNNQMFRVQTCVERSDKGEIAILCWLEDYGV